MNSRIAAILMKPKYDVSAISLFNRMIAVGEAPTTARMILINNFIVAEKLNGNWAKYDCLWFTAAHGVNSSRLNWIKPASDLTSTAYPTFVTDSSIYGNGTNQYFNTNFNLLTDSINYTANNASYGCFIKSGSSTSTNMGATASGGVGMQGAFRTSGSVVARINGSSVSSATAASKVGLHSVVLNSGIVSSYLNGLSYKSNTQSTNVLQNITPYLCAFNNMGSPLSYNADSMSFFYYASGDLNYAGQNTNVSNFLTSL